LPGMGQPGSEKEELFGGGGPAGKLQKTVLATKRRKTKLIGRRSRKKKGGE